MFEKETVFILGAGASWHYNYPTGADLVKRIIEKAEIIIRQLGKKSDQIKWYQDLENFFRASFQMEMGIYPNSTQFVGALASRLRFSDPPVIDHFLGWNESLQNLGQMLIAWEILECERKYKGSPHNWNRKKLEDQDRTKFKDNWYRFLLYKMLVQCVSKDDFLKNKVNFITFNYDVSLENYLYKSLGQGEFLKKGGLNNNDIKSFLKNRIIHVYGSVRPDPYSDDVPIFPNHMNPEIQTDNKRFSEMLKLALEASKGIKTISSQKESDPGFEEKKNKVRALIENAEDVYILGYGFDDQNSDRLGLRNLLEMEIDKKRKSDLGRVKKNIYFTNFQDMNVINKKASGLFSNGQCSFVGADYIYKPSLAHSKSVYEKSIKDVYRALDEDFGLI